MTGKTASALNQLLTRAGAAEHGPHSSQITRVPVNCDEKFGCFNGFTGHALRVSSHHGEPGDLGCSPGNISTDSPADLALFLLFHLPCKSLPI